MHATKTHGRTIAELLMSCKANFSHTSESSSSENDDEREGHCSVESSSDDAQPSGRFGQLPVGRMYSLSVYLHVYTRICVFI